MIKLGRPTGRDVVSGLVTGLFSIPEGMAYASIGGFNPVLGLYSGMVPTVVGSIFARTVLMTTTLTSAIALSSQSVLAQAGLNPADLGNVTMLTLMVGVVMAVFGLLRLGSLLSFVSMAVMTGFTTGIAVQIVVGVLGDATGYDPAGHNKLAQVVDWVAHAGLWKPTTVVVTLLTVAVWVAARLVRPLASLATLVALAVGTAVVTIFGLEVELVGNIAKITDTVPLPMLPHWEAAPHLALGAVAVALVALAQAAGIGAAVPNPDGSRTSLSGDFFAQGVANLAGGFFRALPTGGSLSRTGVAVSAGARTRWAGIFAGLWLTAIVIVAGRWAEYIPMPVIGGLVLVIGGELIWERRSDILLILRTAPLPAVAMIATFLATTQWPLQNAIILGAVLSMILYCVKAAHQARLIALVPGDEPGTWRTAEVPEVAKAGEITVLHYAGVSLFAELARTNELWPRVEPGAVIVLSVRTLPDVPSATLIRSLVRRADQLREQGSRLIIVGIDPRLATIFERTGLTARLGADNVLAAEPQIFKALNDAVAREART
ncbi:SulP family inorganic anion transporter [Nonomuraea sp. NBC_01738]|uniref:SulP family inorganic anion transporter n=1 Tax=Nonomuraea sp. NBC_01738 TaxID=2976003 RepID=UPI002E0FB3C5|nr:SulP family inorganic anion transporter [Nonomuraea sp. NBC_01738]